MSTFQDRAEFKINWRPFQLNPGASREGVNKLEMYKEKFGEQMVQQMVPRLTQVFANEGLQYSLGGLTGSTLNSHRLIAAAQERGVGNEVVEELMRAYFSEEKFINDRAVLVEAGRKAGLSDAEKIVDDEQLYLAQVKEELRTFGSGVRGVPIFLINGQLAFSGAQEARVFESAFEEIISGGSK
mmetsp:Transcript_37811/g.106843  ORF Transcript_37811/g.106843 Transcript_37811/m.106843 type:complete len:184 (-) Transcript_37811:229-780(-)